MGKYHGIRRMCPEDVNAVMAENTVAVDFYHHASFRTEATGVDGNTGEEEFGMTWRR